MTFLMDVRSAHHNCARASVLMWFAALFFAAAAFFLTAPVSAQSGGDDRPALLSPGDAVVTEFSGTRTDDPIPQGEHPVDRTFIDPEGVSARILHLGDLGTPPRGQVSDVDRSLNLKAADIGQVFGVVLAGDGEDDSHPDIYLSATSLYGLYIVTDGPDGKPLRQIRGTAGARWQDGQFGNAKGGTPGAIWKVDGTTGEVSLFANVTHDGKENSGAGLGNLAHDPQSGSIYVSDLETGLIQRFSSDGQAQDAFDHGIAGRDSVRLEAVGYDVAGRVDITDAAFDAERTDSWGYAPIERRVFGMAIQGGRLYYAVAEGPTIWSVSLEEDGRFGDDPRIETDIADATPDTDITSIVFDTAGDMYLAQRGATKASYDYTAPTASQTAPVLRYSWSKDAGNWTARTDEYAVGLADPYRTTDGGVALNYGFDNRGRIDLNVCRRTVWMTGSALRNGEDRQLISTGGSRTVEGVQGVYLDKVRPENMPPREAWYVDNDGLDGHSEPAGLMGAIAIYSPCTPAETFPPGDIELPPDYDDYRPPLDDPSITIAKRCNATALGGNVTCDITVRNVSNTPLTDPLHIDDLTHIMAGPNAGASVQVISFAVPDPSIACTPTPIANFSCTIPPGQLMPGQSVTISVDLSTAALVLAGNTGVRNCASFDHPMGVGMACAESGQEIVVDKVGPPICMPNGTCRFGISVSNVGFEPYSGDVILADDITVNGAGGVSMPITAVNPPIACTSGNTNQVPFTCVTPMSLAPGETRIHWIDVTMPAPGGYTAENCFGALDAGLFPAGPVAFPLPGIGNGNPSCVTVTVPIPEPNLAVSKAASGNGRCAKVCADLECDFDIGITNENDVPFVGPVSFDETVPAGATLLPPGPPFACVAGPPNYSCNSAGNITIAPGDTYSIPVRVRIPVAASEALGCNVPNDVTLTSPPGGLAPNIDPTDDHAQAVAWTFGMSWVNPVTGVTFVMCDPTNLKLEKVANGDCVKAGGGYRCDFDIRIENMGPDPYKGPVRFTDTFSIAPQSVAFNGDFNCAQSGGSAYNCETPIIDLPKGGVLNLNVKATVPDSGACDIENTANLTFPLAGSRGNGNGSDDTDSASAGIPSPRCSKTSSSVPPPRVVLCPDGRPMGRSGRCPCPGGTVWNKRLDRCIGDQPLCLDPVRRRTDGTCCPRGMSFDRQTGRCQGEPPVLRCPDPDRRKRDGSCCPFGTVPTVGGNSCRTVIVDECEPGSSWSRVANRCVRDPNNCRRGEYYDRRRGRCVSDDEPESAKPDPSCRDGEMRGRDGGCYCPKGTERNRRTGRCEEIDDRPPLPLGGGRPDCRPNEIRMGRNCVPRPDDTAKPCPRGEVRIGKRCVERSSDDRRPCEEGEIRVGNRCVERPGTDTKACGPNEVRIGKRCVERSSDDRRPCEEGEIRVGNRCVERPGTDTKPCGPNEVRIGKRCVARSDDNAKDCPEGTTRRGRHCRPDVRQPKDRTPNVDKQQQKRQEQQQRQQDERQQKQQQREQQRQEQQKRQQDQRQKQQQQRQDQQKRQQEQRQKQQQRQEQQKRQQEQRQQKQQQRQEQQKRQQEQRQQRQQQRQEQQKRQQEQRQQRQQQQQQRQQQQQQRQQQRQQQQQQRQQQRQQQQQQRQQQQQQRQQQRQQQQQQRQQQQQLKQQQRQQKQQQRQQRQPPPTLN